MKMPMPKLTVPSTMSPAAKGALSRSRSGPCGAAAAVTPSPTATAASPGMSLPLPGSAPTGPIVHELAKRSRRLPGVGFRRRAARAGEDLVQLRQRRLVEAGLHGGEVRLELLQRAGP